MYLSQGLDTWSYSELVATGEILTTGEWKPHILGGLGGGDWYTNHIYKLEPP